MPDFVNYPQKATVRQNSKSAKYAGRSRPPLNDCKRSGTENETKMNLGEPNLSSPKIRYNCKNYQFFHEILLRIRD
jgi:hypothetical protein